MPLNIKVAEKMDPIGSTLVVFLSQMNGDGEEVKSKAKSSKKKLKSQKIISGLAELDPAISAFIAEAVKEKSFEGKAKEHLFFRSCQMGGVKNLLVVGLGAKKAINSESLRVAGAVTLNQLKAAKVVEEVGIHLPSLLAEVKSESEGLEAFSEGILLADYSFDELKNLNESQTKLDSRKLKNITFISGKHQSRSTLQKTLERSEILTECINLSRRLSDMPANWMTPEILAKETVKAAKGTPLKVTVWDKARIKKERMGGLLGVSLGSSFDPRFIILEYHGAAKSKKPVIFVGKGLTFDSGGISIKPSAQMDEMRYDMCGGANVIGTLLAVARLGLKVNVIGLVPATENMPGPQANKPGDVLVFRNGKTAEVLNTDAEGRLVLADALAYASEQKPAAIFDVATLTGAMVVALSNIYTGFFTREPELRERIEKAGDISGELVWAMPLSDYHVDDIRGNYADWSNISHHKGGGSSTAAAFLEQFVEKGISWAHFDIAGTGWACGQRLPYCSAKGATGVMIRTFVELAKSY